jgi:uncharacterized protein
MSSDGQVRCTAFAGFRRVASGELAQVAASTKEVIDGGEQAPVLIFDDVTGEQIEVDFRGSCEDVLKRLGETTEQAAPRGPGRPRLGVVAHEVTLLPRHWEWLSSQPGGASVALRKLVEQARRENADKDRLRRSQEAAYRFMSALGGDLPGFEEATRAFFAGDRARFEQHLEPWPVDVREHAKKLAAAVFAGSTK